MLIRRVIITLCLVLWPLSAFSEEKPKENPKKDEFYLSPTSNPEIVATFPLNEEFLLKMEAVHKDMAEASITLSEAETGNDSSIDGLVTTISKNDKITEILNKHTLEPKNYVIGYLALQASLAAASSLEDKDAIFDDSTTVSKENLEFGKQFADRIRKLLE